MFKNHEVYTIATTDEARFIELLQAEEAGTAAWFKKEYPEGEDTYEISYDTCEHHGRVAVIAEVDPKWGDWKLSWFMDRMEIPYTTEPGVYEFELKQAPFVFPDVEGFWVEGRSIRWHSIGDEIPR